MLASFAAGCFWGVEEAFLSSGLCTQTTAGYSGGHHPAPTYHQVCTGTTGHAETVLVEYDHDKVAYTDLLKVFWKCHDPTTKNRQGPDVGSQYRSVIFCHSKEQMAMAKESVEGERGRWAPRQIVTEIVMHDQFYPAEPYHQQYLRRIGSSAACHL